MVSFLLWIIVLLSCERNMLTSWAIPSVLSTSLLSSSYLHDTWVHRFSSPSVFTSAFCYSFSFPSVKQKSLDLEYHNDTLPYLQKAGHCPLPVPWRWIPPCVSAVCWVRVVATKHQPTFCAHSSDVGIGIPRIWFQYMEWFIIKSRKGEYSPVCSFIHSLFLIYILVFIISCGSIF